MLTNNNAIDAKTTAIAGPVGAKPISRVLVLVAAAGVAAGLLIAGLGIALPIGLTANQRSRSVFALSAGSSNGGVHLAGTTRHYYLAAEPLEWDYAPAGLNLCSNSSFKDTPAELYTTAGAGTRFRKAVFRQYADAQFKEPLERTPEQIHLGVLGPTLHAQVGDTLVVVLLNKLDWPINLIAGGIDMAGAAPAVNPNDTYTARWYVPPSAGPPADGASTQLWVYRSSHEDKRDTQAGLAGPLVVAAPGMLGTDGKPRDVDREIFLMLQVFNEGDSPFFEVNTSPHSESLAALGEEDAAESLMKYSVNGYTYCNLPGLTMNAGERVRWYVSSLGSEDAIHTAHWHGIVFNASGHHIDQAVVQSSTMWVLDAYTDNPGTWLFHCHLSDHMHGGMMAMFTINGKAEPPALTGRTRSYFIAAEAIKWDYVPFGGEMCGGSLVNFSDNAKTFVQPGPDRIGAKYMKALYREYEDETFTTPKRRPPQWEHLGLLGPVIRAAVGDTILVVFRNSLPDHAASVHAHGVLYSKDSEGSPYADGLPLAPGDAVPPNGTVTYTWLVPERAGPGAADESSVLWMYHSHVNEAADPAAGLLGPILITAAGAAATPDDPTPRDVKSEFVLSFMIMDEGTSFMAPENMAKFLPARLTANASALEALATDPGFQESNLMHAINGYLYCNLPGLEFVQGDSARLYFMALGGSADMHTPNSVESQIFINGHRRQAVALLPGQMLTTDITPVVPGKGLLQCHIYDHISAGMSALFNVKNLGTLVAPPTAKVHTYYIAAEPIEWDYAPLGFDGCTGTPWSTEQMIFVSTSNSTLGSKYRKALFRGYTDGSFSTRLPAPELHGILGPVLRAEVGDKLVVHFINRLPFEASLQPFGGLGPIGNTSAYQVGAAEAEAEAGSAGAAASRQRTRARRLLQISAHQAEAEAVIAQSVDNLYVLNGVAPGGQVRYEWFVPEEAGPASRDGDSIVYSYVSGVDHIKHINSGLVGPLVVYKRGKLSSASTGDGRGSGIVEVPVLFNIQNEMQSAFYEDNLAAQRNVSGLGSALNTSALEFPESNLMHSINGYVYCNSPTLQLSAGQRVRWLVMAFGSEADMHSPVFEGQAVSYAGSPVYSVALMPANTFVVDMVANSTGTWGYYCNVLDHITAGMRGRMIVT